MMVGASPKTTPPAPNAAPYESGMMLGGRYELLRLIGKGGVGQVWAAHSAALDRLVAIKVLLRSQDTESAKRLIAEAQAAAQIEHPAIVRMFDFGVTDRQDPYLVMELLRGESLQGLLDRSGTVKATTLVSIVLPIIDALALAHAKGLIHRDIKPENIFLSSSETRGAEDSGTTEWLYPKVIDFGLVKRAEGDLRTTGEGTLVGSPAYMSPEQVRGLKLDARTDVWSLAVVMYEMLSGRLPFEAKSQYEMFKALVEREPLPFAKPVDDELEAIVLRGLAKSPEARWGSMRDFGHALAKWADAHGVKVDISGTSIRSTWLDKRGPLSVAPPSLAQPPTPAAMTLSDLAALRPNHATRDDPQRTPMPTTRAADERALAATHVIPRPPSWHRFAGVAVGVGVVLLCAAVWLLASRRGQDDRTGLANATTAGAVSPPVSASALPARVSPPAADTSGAPPAPSVASNPTTPARTKPATSTAKATSTTQRPVAGTAAPSSTSTKHFDKELGF